MNRTLRTIGRWLSKLGIGVFRVRGTLALVGAAYQQLGQALDRRAVAPREE